MCELRILPTRTIIYYLRFTIYRPIERRFGKVSSNARRGGGMVDATVSNTVEVKLMRVRVSPPALSKPEVGRMNAEGRWLS